MRPRTDSQRRPAEPHKFLAPVAWMMAPRTAGFRGLTAVGGAGNAQLSMLWLVQAWPVGGDRDAAQELRASEAAVEACGPLPDMLAASDNSLASPFSFWIAASRASVA